MAKRIQLYVPNSLWPTPGLKRILQLRQIKDQTYMTPAEQRELKRLEETQQTSEFLYHRHRRLAARRSAKLKAQ